MPIKSWRYSNASKRPGRMERETAAAAPQVMCLSRQRVLSRAWLARIDLESPGPFIPGEKFISSKRCGICHIDAHAQWWQSAHGNAFREPFYQKNVKDLQSQSNPTHGSVWMV